MSHPPTNFITSPQRQLIRFLFILSGLILIVFAFLRSLDSGIQKTLWVIDNSLSMAVTDISTSTGISISRLDRAKQIVMSGSLIMPGEQAIMTAAYGAKLELPMTDDRAIIRDIVGGITVLSRGGGSSVATPLETIRLIYGSTPHLSIIWITDGEFTDSGATLSGFITLPNIIFLGVGTRSGGPILEGYDADGQARYKESQGKRVNSIRDDARLQSVADSLNSQILLLDGDKIPALLNIAKIPYSTTILSYLLNIGALLIIIGLIIPEFRYPPSN